MVKRAFTFLIENKLGTIEQVIKNGKLNDKMNITEGDSAIWFIKTPVEQIQTIENIEEIFQKYNVTLETYSKSFGKRNIQILN